MLCKPVGYPGLQKLRPDPRDPRLIHLEKDAVDYDARLRTIGVYL
jgi:hypothetical protein